MYFLHPQYCFINSLLLYSAANSMSLALRIWLSLGCKLLEGRDLQCLAQSRCSETALCMLDKKPSWLFTIYTLLHPELTTFMLSQRPMFIQFREGQRVL